MADFYSILKRAIIALPENSIPARRAIYARAREALERQLRGFDPPISDADLLKEQLALEDTIRRLEDENQGQSQEASLQPLPSPVAGDGAEAVSPSVEQKPDLRGPIHESQDVGLVAKRPPRLSPMPDIPHLEPRRGSAASQKPSLPDASAAPPLPAGTPGILPVGIPKPGKRPPAALDKAKPVARLSADAVSRRNRTFIALGLVAMTIVGAIAFFTRDKASIYAAKQVAAPTTPAGVEPGKTEGRLASAESPGGAASSSSTEALLPVLARAFMILEVPGAAPSQHQGRVLWEFTPEPGGKSTEKMLRAQIDFPTGGVRVDVSLSRNLDPSLDVSHTMLVVFETAPSISAVTEMSGIEWRERENQAGIILQGTLVPVQDNFFTLGLDKAEAAITKNIDLIRSQKWMVFEMRFANGRRGAILAEKGATGERIVGDALRSWK